MSSIVEKFALKALHVFQIRTLTQLGLGTRVTLSNKSHSKGPLVTEYRIDLTVFSPDGTTSVYREDIARLPPDSAVSLDCGQWQDAAQDQVMIFHLMPMRLLPQADADQCVDIERSEIWSLFTAQDHYVEYYWPDGFSSGVLYQSGAFNYRKFSREETTVIQAPKVFLTETLDTLLSILHTSFEPGYARQAILKCSLLNAQGEALVKSVFMLAPGMAQSISMKSMLSEAGQSLPTGQEMHHYTLLAMCDNAALLPLVLNVDQSTQTLAVEHSLPPMYYGQSVTGVVRAKMIDELKHSGIFLQEEH
ncbi:hypothetical protein [Herbaspirillum sp. NPDC087042]|uniref:hypothetical protein n=1 Tax=Herbaspirillum sp. NPDC087042 TaxID=3364004 RepID=UPI00381E540B